MTDDRAARRRAGILALKLLRRLEAVHLPLDPLTMARKIPHTRAKSYSEYAVYSGQSTAPLRQVSDYGYTLRRPGGRSMILYNADQSPESIRFTVAHELGHLMLCHPSDAGPLDWQADCFARQLLCPLPYADELGLREAAAYQMVFSVTRDVAEQALSQRREDRALLDPALYAAVRRQFRRAMGRPAPELIKI